MKDILLVIPIVILYNIFIYKSSSLLFNNLNDNDKLQYTIFYFIIVALISFLLAYTIFYKKSKLENKTIRYSLIVGSIILIFSIFTCNWYKLGDELKLLIIFFILVSLLWYCVNQNYKHNIIKKNKKKLNKNAEIISKYVNT